MMVNDRHSGSGDNYGDNDDSSRQSPLPNQMLSSPGHVAETGRPPPGSSPASLQTPLMPGAFHAENAPSARILGRAPQEPFTSNSDPLPNEPVQPGLPVCGPTVSPIQTFVAQTIQMILPEIPPGLIQGEVRIQCAQLAQEIGTQISSIRDEAIGPTGDPDDPMLPSGGIKGSRGGDNRSARCSYNKRKGKQVTFAKESDSEADEMDKDDEGSGS